MTRTEVRDMIYHIIEEAVRNGGPSLRDVDAIFEAMGRLTPEPTVKQQVPAYDQKKVKRVGTLVQRSQFTQEQRNAAVEALRAVGLL